MIGLVTARQIAEDSKPVPSIDGHDSQHELYQLLLTELLLRLFIDIIRYTSFCDQGNRFGKSQRGTLSISVVRRIALDTETIQPLLGFAACSSIFAMHINAVCTVVDLRGAEFDQIQQ